MTLKNAIEKHIEFIKDRGKNSGPSNRWLEIAKKHPNDFPCIFASVDGVNCNNLVRGHVNAKHLCTHGKKVLNVCSYHEGILNKKIENLLKEYMIPKGAAIGRGEKKGIQYCKVWLKHVKTGEYKKAKIFIEKSSNGWIYGPDRWWLPLKVIKWIARHPRLEVAIEKFLALFCNRWQFAHVPIELQMAYIYKLALYAFNYVCLYGTQINAEGQVIKGGYKNNPVYHKRFDGIKNFLLNFDLNSSPALFALMLPASTMPLEEIYGKDEGLGVFNEAHYAVDIAQSSQYQHRRIQDLCFIRVEGQILHDENRWPTFIISLTEPSKWMNFVGNLHSLSEADRAKELFKGLKVTPGVVLPF